MATNASQYFTQIPAFVQQIAGAPGAMTTQAGQYFTQIHPSVEQSWGVPPGAMIQYLNQNPTSLQQTMSFIPESTAASQYCHQIPTTAQQTMSYMDRVQQIMSSIPEFMATKVSQFNQIPTVAQQTTSSIQGAMATDTSQDFNQSPAAAQQIMSSIPGVGSMATNSHHFVHQIHADVQEPMYAQQPMYVQQQAVCGPHNYWHISNSHYPKTEQSYSSQDISH